MHTVFLVRHAPDESPLPAATLSVIRRDFADAAPSLLDSSSSPRSTFPPTSPPRFNSQSWHSHRSLWFYTKRGWWPVETRTLPVWGSLRRVIRVQSTESEDEEERSTQVPFHGRVSFRAMPASHEAWLWNFAHDKNSSYFFNLALFRWAIKAHIPIISTVRKEGGRRRGGPWYYPVLRKYTPLGSLKKARKLSHFFG